jgi:anti-sigma B factor antagonist
MDLILSTHHTGRRTLVTLRGELDLASYRAFKELVDELIVLRQVDLVIDLEDVTFVDSLGLGALVSTRRKTEAFGGSLELVCTNPAVLKVFRLTHLDRVFTLLDGIPDDLKLPETVAD